MRIYFYCKTYNQRVCPEMCQARRTIKTYPFSSYIKCKRCRDLRSFEKIPKIEKGKIYGGKKRKNK